MTSVKITVQHLPADEHEEYHVSDDGQEYDDSSFEGSQDAIEDVEDRAEHYKTLGYRVLLELPGWMK